MTTHIITEMHSDAVIVERVVADLGGSEMRLAYGGGTMAMSQAMTTLVKTGEPVVLVLDAETHDPLRAHERALTIKFLLDSAAHSVPNRVVLAVPTMAVILVEQPVVLAALLGCDLAEAADLSASERAVREPKRLLLEHLGEAAQEPDALAERLRALSPDERTALRSGPTAQRIRQAVLDLLPQPANA